MSRVTDSARRYTVQVRLTAEERLRLIEASEAAGLPMSEYVRQRAIGVTATTSAKVSNATASK